MRSSSSCSATKFRTRADPRSAMAWNSWSFSAMSHPLRKHASGAPELLKPRGFPADNTYMATSPIAAKGAANVTGPKPGSAAADLAALLKKGPLSTSDDLENALKKVSPDALADALIANQPGASAASPELATALLDKLRSDTTSGKATTERLVGLPSFVI